MCVVVVVHEPTEKDNNERESFWNDLERILGRAGSGYRLYEIENLNSLADNRVSDIITEVFGVPSENENRRRVVDLCSEGTLCV